MDDLKDDIIKDVEYQVNKHDASLTEILKALSEVIQYFIDEYT